MRCPSAPIVILALLLAGAGCVEHDLHRPYNFNCAIPREVLPQRADYAVDLLVVMDNSGSMMDEQSMLGAQFGALFTALRNAPGGLPDLHLGVTSTNLGDGGHGLLYCDGEGDGGRLLTHTCANPAGAPYLVDVAPRGCVVDRDLGGLCTAHQCDASHCAHEPSAVFVEDAVTGCPRCRNYSGEELEDAFACLANLGGVGCGFEQPLEAMRRALDDHPDNVGFLRDTAFLSVLIVTDEDDCSAADPVLFSADATSLDSPLGPLTGFRCFEFGVTCDENDRLAEGLRTGCGPREDPEALLHPVSGYVEFLRSLKDDHMLVVAAIDGPVTDDSVTVGRDAYDQPEVEFSCDTQRGGGVPAIRIKSLIKAFNDDLTLAWADAPICAPTFTDALEGMGDHLRDRLGLDCLPRPLSGCSDPGVEDDCAENDTCRPDCMVLDVLERDTPDEKRKDVYPCLEICPDGRCRGNTDPSRAYANGTPALRDPDLPVEACWQIVHDPLCTRSRGTSLIISRRADPPLRSFAYVACKEAFETEQLCNDGVDNDEDCLVDLDDPDCRY